MKETIILSNIKEKELLKTLAINNVVSFNTRIFNAENLAKEVLLRNGIILDKKQINTTTQECIIYNIVSKSNGYFKNSTFEDARNINKAITTGRLLCRGDEESKLNDVLGDGEFKEKNIALLDVYKEYKKQLKDNNQIDSIDIINYAINQKKTIDCDFVIFKETKLGPLEEELLKVVSNNKYKEKYIREFANKEDKKLSGCTYDNAYGAVNEIEYILGYIGENKIPYEKCSIVLIDNTYINHLLTYKNTYGVPMTFGTGLDISLSSSYKVLDLINKWEALYCSTDGLINLLNSNVFDTDKLWQNVSNASLNGKQKGQIIKTIGNLKVSAFDLETKLNDYKSALTEKEEIENYPIVENMFREITKGYSYLVKTYSKIIDEVLDTRAKTTICSYIDEYLNNISDGKLIDILEALGNKKICKELSREGSVHVTDLTGALANIREHMFICGLNAKVFPGSPKEDYLLLDSDLDRFNETNVKKSDTKIILNKQLLMGVIDNASAFGSTIHISYAGYSLNDLKEENPSSLLYEIYKKENGDSSTTESLKEAIGEQHKYFDENISSLKDMGEKYMSGVDVKQIDDIEGKTTNASIKKPISPSACDIFFECPKRFYLKYVLGINEIDEDDPFNILPANDEGTLIHSCMEDYGNNPSWSKQEFMDNAESKFENYFKKRIPLNLKEIPIRKQQYLDMAEEGYDSDPHNKVYMSEYKFDGFIDPDTKLVFGGIVDRVEILPNGKYQIVDYKTYKNIKNENEDVDTCFQVLLYAYLLELKEKENNVEVEKCEYRYLRNPRTITCTFDDGARNGLKTKLNEIKEAIDTGIFNYPSEKDREEACKYCKLKNICGVKKLKENKEVDE